MEQQSDHCPVHPSSNPYCASCIEAKRAAQKPSTEPPSTDQKQDEHKEE